MMEQTLKKLIFFFLWLLLYGYYVERVGTIQKGRGKRLAVAGLGIGLLLGAFWFLPALTWLLLTLLFFLYTLFFDEEPFQKQWWRVLLMGVLFWMASLLPVRFLFVGNGAVLFSLFVLLADKREYLKGGNAVMMAALYVLLTAFLGLSGQEAVVADGFWRRAFLWGGVCGEALLFFMAEGALFSYKKSFAVQTEQFQRDVLGHQYEEIRSIYLNMRGWRHDYHNHLQVIKAQLALNNLEETRRYLDELEHDLDRVDTWVKSGNLMVDAILNSKLSLAESKKIAVNCKAVLPETLSVEDVDLCVILGNLLDNALEACGQIPQDKRFLRIYMNVNKSQLYLSVQNAAKEELDFNERNYITNKRGNHGFGMRRVRAAVEKYEGFLHLANEPGIFAAEVTMPLAEVGDKEK